jgi:type II secretory pathway component PulF
MDMELPFTTKILIWVSELIENHGLLIFITLVFGFSFLFWLLKRKFMHPITHFIILRIPIIKNISSHTNLASVCRTLATLLKSGLNIDEALTITKNTASNYYYRKSLEKATKRITQGTRLSENLEIFSLYFPKLVTSMIRVGERSGKLEETLFYLAEFYDAEVDNSTKALSTAIEPVLLIFIGLAVGGMAMSIITPIYQITGNVSK